MAQIEGEKTRWSPLGTARLQFIEGLEDESLVKSISPDLIPPEIRSLQNIFIDDRFGNEYFYQALDMIGWGDIDSSDPRFTILMSMMLYIENRLSTGSTCVLMREMLDDISETLVHKLGYGLENYSVEKLETLISSKQADWLIGNIDEIKPLILTHDKKYLYHQKNYVDEQSFINFLAKRLQMLINVPSQENVLSAVQEVTETRPILIGENSLRLAGEQLLALVLSLYTPLLIISGGPGTGKTSIVVTILRVLKRLGMANHIGLVAPTGRAARRMRESIESGLSHVKDFDQSIHDQDLKASLPDSQTLHRFLGFSPSTGRFKYHENNPLEHDIVIVDEASMVDMAMMARLTRAVTPQLHHFKATPRLILLGDANQLPSVGAGAVLMELVPEKPSLPQDMVSLLKELMPQIKPLIDQYSQNPENALSGKVVQLTHSYRQRESDPAGRNILGVAKMINEINSADLTAALFAQKGEDHSMRRIDSPKGVNYDKMMFLEQENTPKQLSAFVNNWINNFMNDEDIIDLTRKIYSNEEDVSNEQDFHKLFDFYSRFRVLTFTRILGGYGSEKINRLFRNSLLKITPFSHQSGSPFYPGAPVMILENDYDNQLFNGDQGLFLQFRHPEHQGIELKAVFPVEGKYRSYYDYQLKKIQLSYAITIHKSQGSEYDHVAIILPTNKSDSGNDENTTALPEELMSKEMIYTAITRAKKSALILGERKILEKTILRKTLRHSGLKSFLFSSKL